MLGLTERRGSYCIIGGEMYLLSEYIKEDSDTLITTENHTLITGKPIIGRSPHGGRQSSELE